jgi:hypothetical protein
MRLRTGNRRSATVITSRGLPGIDVRYSFLGRYRRPFAMSSGLGLCPGPAMLALGVIANGKRARPSPIGARE